MSFFRIVRLTALISLVPLLGMFLYLAPRVFVGDSEFWSISMGYHLWAEYGHDWVFTRPLFYILIWISQVFVKTPSESLICARALFALNGLFLLVFVFQILRALTKDLGIAATGVVVLLGNTGFLNQGFRIRSDLLASTLALFCLVGWLSDARHRRQAGMFLLPLLATPKAIVQVVCLSPLLVSGALGALKFLKRRWIYLSALILGLLFLNRHYVEYFLNAFSGGAGAPTYFSVESYFHVGKQIYRNPIFWSGLGLRGLTLFLRAKKNRPLSSDELKVFWVSLLALGFVFFAVDKVQFFIAAMLPFLALQVALALNDLGQLGAQSAQALFIFLFSVCSVFGGGYWTSLNLEENNNQFQLKTLNGVDRILKDENIEDLWDFTCLIPWRCKERHFLGPHQSAANRAGLLAFVQSRPRVFFYLKKDFLIEPDLSRVLESSYESQGRGVFVLRRDLFQTEAIRQDQSQKIVEQIHTELDSLFGHDIEY